MATDKFLEISKVQLSSPQKVTAVPASESRWEGPEGENVTKSIGSSSAQLPLAFVTERVESTVFSLLNK